MDLGGKWRATRGDDALRREFADPDFDDRSWHELPVPGHWRNDPAFANCDGPVLYRRTFTAPAPASDRRWWLTLEGCFYQGDVWLDGAYLGDTEGYFFPHHFEVTDLLRERDHHVLAVELTCAPQNDRAAKRNITGVFQHWDCIDPDWNPGGIWRPVMLNETGPVRIARLRASCTEASTERAIVSLQAELDTEVGRGAHILTTVGDVDHTQDVTLAAGTNRVEWTVAVADPDLWWPRSLGGQPLYDVEVSVTAADADADASDHRSLRMGLRSVEMRNWVFRVNGERMFLKGSNAAPVRQDLGDASVEDMRRDVGLAVDAGLDLLRVHAHISRPELYDAADEAGLVIWQDFPLQWGYARGLRPQAVRQVDAAIDLLAQHPSIAMWCGHNEPMAISETEIPERTIDMAKLAVKVARHQLFPTWNKSVLDRSIKRAFEKGDGTRPVIAHSGVWPHAPQFDGTDTHVYFGWYHGHEREFPAFLRAAPRMARFVTEFGAQAIPPNDDFIDVASWPELDWDQLRHKRNLQKNVFERVVPPGDFATYAEWKAATGEYQATVIRHHIEALRKLKYRPTGGFCQFSFNDAYPSVTWSVLDHLRAPKPGYEALIEACRPVIVVCDRLPELVRPGDTLVADVHVVSDLRTPLSGGRCTARLSWDGGEHTWGWEGDVDIDSVCHVGRVEAVVPDVSGTLQLDLTFDAGEITASNRDTTRIVAG
ncbi:MAG TPA: hypothetical protein VGA13_09665 [Acidimicrobiales bacterium]|jgi:beta-mannosidase